MKTFNSINHISAAMRQPKQVAILVACDRFELAGKCTSKTARKK